MHTSRARKAPRFDRPPALSREVRSILFSLVFEPKVRWSKHLAEFFPINAIP